MHHRARRQSRRDVAGVAARAEVAVRHRLEREPRQDRHAVVGLLAPRDDVRVAERVHRLERQQLHGRLGLLQAEDVGRLLAEEAFDEGRAEAHRVDVPGRDTDGHGRLLAARRGVATGKCPDCACPGNPALGVMRAAPISLATPAAYPSRPPASADVVVIGGGIVGVATALFLRRRGLAVVLLEKGRVAGEQSSRNWGWIRQQGRDPAELPLMIEARALWHTLAAETGEDIGLAGGGVAYLARRPRDLAAFAGWLPHAAAHRPRHPPPRRARDGGAAAVRASALLRRAGHALRHACRARARGSGPRPPRRARGRGDRRELRRPPPRRRRRAPRRRRHRGRARPRPGGRPCRRRLVGALSPRPRHRAPPALGQEQRRRDAAAPAGVERRGRRRSHRLPTAAGRRLHHRRRWRPRPLPRPRRDPRGDEVPAVAARRPARDALPPGGAGRLSRRLADAAAVGGRRGEPVRAHARARSRARRRHRRARAPPLPDAVPGARRGPPRREPGRE